MTPRFPISLVLALALVAGAARAAPEYGYRVLRSYPHDPTAFTEGLFYLHGALYESTGLEQHSEVRKVRLVDGQVLQRRVIAPQYFGEGVVAWRDRLIELTWRSQVGFVYDLASFRPEGQFSYAGEGWALTQDGRHLIMRDGTADLRFLDPQTLKEVARLHVTDQGRPVENLNELEWVKGEIYANIWQTDRIARIDPHTGRVVGWIDLAGLLPDTDRVPGQTDVLNGIAYDAEHDRLFVTGKMWPRLFQLALVRKAAAP